MKRKHFKLFVKIFRTFILVFSIMYCLPAYCQETIQITSSKKTEKILRKTRRRLNGDFAKSESKKSLYFLQQTLEGQEQEETLEAVLEARSSVNLRDMTVLSGQVSNKMAENPTLPHSIVSALYHSLQLGPMICREPYWANIMTPFKCSVPPEGGHYENSEYAPRPIPDLRYPVKFKDNYDVQVEKLEGDDRRNVYKAELKIKKGGSIPEVIVDSSKYEVIRHVLIGTMYLDKGGKRLRSFSGELAVEHKGEKANTNYECHVQVEYTHRRGFTEVEKLHCSVSIEGHRYNLQLVNIGHKMPSSKPVVPVDGDIIKAIKQAGYNPELMESKEVREAKKTISHI